MQKVAWDATRCTSLISRQEWGVEAGGRRPIASRAWRIRRDERARTDICIRDSGARGKPGIDVHVSRTLGEADITTVDRIPCTTVARTLVDLGDVVPRRGSSAPSTRPTSSGEERS
jgi:hypothetical protein